MKNKMLSLILVILFIGCSKDYVLNNTQEKIQEDLSLIINLDGMTQDLIYKNFTVNQKIKDDVRVIWRIPILAADYLWLDRQSNLISVTRPATSETVKIFYKLKYNGKSTKEIPLSLTIAGKDLKIEGEQQSEYIVMMPSIDTMLVNSSKRIYTNVVTDQIDVNNAITWSVSPANLATISDTGVLTAKKLTGTVKVTAQLKRDSDIINSALINIIKPKEDKTKIRNIDATLIDLDDEKSVQKIVCKAVGEYRSRGTSFVLPSGEIIFINPKGHGAGPLLLKKSTDNGKTWSDFLNTPKSWAYSQEIPTAYKLDLINGTHKYILTSGRPGTQQPGTEGDDSGFDYSISDDGINWTEYSFCDTPHITTVAMASLIQLKDQTKNQYIDKWMGVYHSKPGENWKIYLSFDKNGSPVWSKPERLFATNALKNSEEANALCETAFIRSPNNKKIAAIFRQQKKQTGSMISFSTDEGENWTLPKFLPASLGGERHKGAYLKDGRLVIAFREVIYKSDFASDWVGGEFCAWVGTFLDLEKGYDGDYLVLLKRDYTPNANSGDCGYPSMDILLDGSLFITGYGVFETDAHVKPSVASTASKYHKWSPYIMSFTLTPESLDAFARTHKKDFDESWRKYPKGPSHISSNPADACTGDSKCLYHLDSIVYGNSQIKQHQTVTTNELPKGKARNKRN